LREKFVDESTWQRFRGVHENELFSLLDFVFGNKANDEDGKRRDLCASESGSTLLTIDDPTRLLLVGQSVVYRDDKRTSCRVLIGSCVSLEDNALIESNHKSVGDHRIAGLEVVPNF
jgi:hypothetical protein